MKQTLEKLQMSAATAISMLVIVVSGALTIYGTWSASQTEIALIKQRQENKFVIIDQRLDKIEKFIESSDVAVLKNDIQNIKNDIKDIKIMFLELVNNSRDSRRANGR